MQKTLLKAHEWGLAGGHEVLAPRALHWVLSAECPAPRDALVPSAGNCSCNLQPRLLQRAK